MCDFRHIDSIRMKDGRVVHVDTIPIFLNPAHNRAYTGGEWDNSYVPWKSWDPPPDKVPGMYLVGCSGVGNFYYDGSSWLDEGKDYTVESSHERLTIC